MICSLFDVVKTIFTPLRPNNNTVDAHCHAHLGYQFNISRLCVYLCLSINVTTLHFVDCIVWARATFSLFIFDIFSLYPLFFQIFFLSPLSTITKCLVLGYFNAFFRNYFRLEVLNWNKAHHCCVRIARQLLFVPKMAKMQLEESEIYRKSLKNYRKKCLNSFSDKRHKRIAQVLRNALNFNLNFSFFSVRSKYFF